MRLTRESEYALLGLAFVASRPSGEVVPLAEIAAARRLPRTFLAKTFQKLARHGLLVAHRGPGRGYALARHPAGISLREVLEAIEGPELFSRCLFWSTHCTDTNPCLLHQHLRGLVPEVSSVLERLTLTDLAGSPLRLASKRMRATP